MLIRLAASSDLDEVTALIGDAYSKYLTRTDRPPAPLLRDHSVAVASGHVWVIGEPVIGAITMTPSEDALLIENLAVASSQQGKGIGRMLLQFAERQACTLALDATSLYINVVMWENLAIYTHLGYVVVDHREEDGYQRIYMRKKLA